MAEETQTPEVAEAVGTLTDLAMVKPHEPTEEEHAATFASLVIDSIELIAKSRDISPAIASQLHKNVLQLKAML